MDKKVTPKKTVVDAFVEGARNGFGISANSMAPNVMFAFVLIQILNLTGLSDILGFQNYDKLMEDIELLDGAELLVRHNPLPHPLKDVCVKGLKRELRVRIYGLHRIITSLVIQ